MLREFAPDDVDNLVELDGDPEVMRYMTGSRATQREVIERDELPVFMRRSGGYGFWAAVEKASGAFVGWFHLRPREDGAADEPELGYRLGSFGMGEGLCDGGLSFGPLPRRQEPSRCNLPSPSEVLATMAMSDSKEMSMAENNGGSLDALLAKMPQIAEAVSKFPETVQQQAFDALMAEATGGSSAGGPTGTTGEQQRSSRGRASARRKKASGNAEPANKRRRAGGPTEVRDLDLAPKGKTSLKDFANGKQPKTQDDMNAVYVYYLLDVVKVSPVTLDHVYTCYREAKVRTPTNLRNSLALTASRKGYLDTANLEDIALTPRGRNYVEYDLPSTKETAK
jgi:Acetyltransferase (GNAT) domain